MQEIYYHRPSLEQIKSNQLTELYIANTLKTLGASLIGVFIPIYLYQLGYGVSGVALFFAATFMIRILTDNIASWLTGYYGPKHVMIVSYIFLIITLSLLLSLESQNWPISLISFTNAIAMGFFFISFHIEFSKLQSAKAGGREIGNMFKVVKLASAMGPLIGGVIATFLGVQLTIIVAIILVLSSAIPLSLGPEPVRKRQLVTYKGFPWKSVKWNLISNAGLAVDRMGGLFIWPLYVSIVFFSTEPYLNVGMITSIGLVMSFVLATQYGKLIDRNNGGRLLKFGVWGQSISNLLRIFIPSVSSVYLYNFFSDPVSVAVTMPYIKGFYGEASSYEGYRDVYIAAMMTVANIVRALVFVVLYILIFLMSDVSAMRIIFLLAAVTTPITLSHHFKALK